MSINIKCSPEVISSAVRKLKNNKRVAEDATFNFNESGLRREVSYRDIDFLEYLSYGNEEKIVDDCIKLLKENKVINYDIESYDKKVFMNYRMQVKKLFEKEWGTITPAMERLFYMLSSVRQPKNIVAIGVFWGNALAWNIGTSTGTEKVYEVDKIIALDLNSEVLNKAKNNFDRIDNNHKIDFIAEDGVTFAENFKGKIDYLYLDVGISQIEKMLNYEILKRIYPRLEEGAWVVTHDTTHPYFTRQFEKYLNFVRDKDNFRESICFDIDQYGLEVSIK